MLLNCPVNGNAQSREPVNQDYSRVSNRQKETIIRFRNIGFSLPYSLYLNLHLIDSLQHWQNCILRTRRSFQTFTQCYMLGSKLLKGKERFCTGFGECHITVTARSGELTLNHIRNRHHCINSNILSEV